MSVQPANLDGFQSTNTTENEVGMNNTIDTDDNFMPGASKTRVVLYGIEDDDDGVQNEAKEVPTIPVCFIEPLLMESISELWRVEPKIGSIISEVPLPAHPTAEGFALPSSTELQNPGDTNSKMVPEAPTQLDLSIQEPVFLVEASLDDDDEEREIVHVGGLPDFTNDQPKLNDQNCTLFEAIRNVLSKNGNPSGYISANPIGLIPSHLHLAECLGYLADQKLDINNQKLLEDKVERAVCDLLMPFLATVKEYYLQRLKKTKILWKNCLENERPEISSGQARHHPPQPLVEKVAQEGIAPEPQFPETITPAEKPATSDPLKVRLIIADKAPSRKRSPFRRLISTMAAFTSRSPRANAAKRTPKFSSEAPPRLEYTRSIEPGAIPFTLKQKEKPMSVRRDLSFEEYARLNEPVADELEINRIRAKKDKLKDGTVVLQNETRIQDPRGHTKLGHQDMDWKWKYQKHLQQPEEKHSERRASQSTMKHHRNQGNESEDENSKLNKVRTLSQIEIFHVKRRGRKIPYLPSHVVDRNVFVKTVRHMRQENLALGIPPREEGYVSDSFKDRRKKKEKHRHRRSGRSSRLGKREYKPESSEESERECDKRIGLKKKQKVSDYSISVMKSEDERSEQGEPRKSSPHAKVSSTKGSQSNAKAGAQTQMSGTPLDFQAMFSNMGMGFNPFIASMNLAAMYTMMMQQQQQAVQKPSGMLNAGSQAIPMNDPAAVFAQQMQSWPTLMGLPGFAAPTPAPTMAPPPFQPIVPAKPMSPQKTRQETCTAPTPYFPSPTRGNLEALDHSFASGGRRSKSPELSIKKEHMSPIREQEPILEKISKYLCIEGNAGKFESSTSNEKAIDADVKAAEPLKKKEKNGKRQMTKGITDAGSYRTLQLDSEESEQSFGSQSLQKPSLSPQPADRSQPEQQESTPLDSSSLDLFGLHSSFSSHPKPLPHSKPRGPPMRALIHPSSSSFYRRTSQRRHPR